MPRRFVLSFALLAVATNLCAQHAPAKFRVAGKVVNAVDGHPVAGAEVWFANAENFEATLQKLLTGDDGTFAFAVEKSGKYLLSGEANGFQRQGFEQHGMYSSAIVVGEGLNTDNLIFRLRPDAHIWGMIEDEGHEPVQGADIYLFRTDASLGLKQTSLAGQTTSDDRGRYRLAHLEPGFYYVVVSANPWFGALLNDRFNAAGSDPSPADKPEFNVAYPTTFYPGVTDLGSAAQIALKTGESFTADFRLELVPALRIRLNHVNPDPDKPTNVTLQQRVFGTTVNPMPPRQFPVEDSVEIRGLAPGRYLLETESLDPSNRSKRSMLLNLAEDAEVDPKSTSAVTAIHGEVRMQGGAGWPTQGIVRLWNRQTEEVLDSPIGQKGQINFNSDLVTPGTYAVYAMSDSNSTIASIKATGAQVAGQTVQISGGKPVDLEIEMSSTTSKINGTARRDGKPVAGAMILLVPDDAENNLPKFRRDESDSDGTFSLLDVLPGRYRVLAIEDGWELEWANLSVLKKGLERARKIEVQASKTYQTFVDVE
jgi:hypothetical protein